jgi:kinesin family protein 3/17
MASLTKKSSKTVECVKVVVRCRPLFQREVDQGDSTIVEMDERGHTVFLSKPPSEQQQQKEAPRQFSFDFVYGPESKQQTIFEETARPIVDSVIGGYS